MKLEPIEALEPLIHLVGCDWARGKPGAIVGRQRPEVRDALSKLTSDEVSKVRVPEWICCFWRPTRPRVDSVRKGKEPPCAGRRGTFVSRWT